MGFFVGFGLLAPFFLAFWLVPKGYKPQSKRIRAAVLRGARACTGAVPYFHFRDHWSRPSLVAEELAIYTVLRHDRLLSGLFRGGFGFAVGRLPLQVFASHWSPRRAVACVAVLGLPAAFCGRLARGLDYRTSDDAIVKRAGFHGLAPPLAAIGVGRQVKCC